jgi:pyruvate,water dikinase
MEDVMPTILGNFQQFLRDMRQRKRAGSTGGNQSVNAAFRFRYTLFKELLTANSELLSVLSDMDEKLQGDKVFGFAYLRAQVSKSLRNAFQMAKCLNVMSDGKYRELYEVLERINGEVKAILDERKIDYAPSYTAPFDAVNLENADWAGGKNANLGEIHNRLHLPIPAGFAITTKAFHRFIEANDLKEEIIRKKNLIYVDEFNLLEELSKEVIALIENSPTPDDLQAEILTMSDALWPPGRPVLLAMRSSAVGEDGDISYAGQYLTKLGVTRETLEESYKAIIASLYSARSISYRSSKGVYDEDLAMAVSCLEMVDSQASGVLYTRHPYDITNDNILINAVWGLGPYAVDGVVIPDAYTVTKDDSLEILERRISDKPVRLSLNAEGGVREMVVDESLRQSPCLHEEQIRVLAGYGLALERHYKCPQDVEWALAPDGRLFILQSRPLKIQNPKRVGFVKAAPLPGYELLLENGEIACQGVGFGPVYLVENDADLPDFPDGAILVAGHSSPEYVIVMRRCRAIIVEAGSVSGHMAALSREFGVPTIISPHPIMDAMSDGMEITVDAYSGRVYRGRVVELLNALPKKDDAHMKDTPVYEYLRRIASFISPLNLVNPDSPDFRAANCRTLHDLARFCHEYSYSEMFQISDLASKHHGWSLRLAATLPIDIHLIDLGQGLVPGADTGGRSVKPEDIASAPFLALLKGMREVHGNEPRPINFSGLFAVIREQSLDPGHIGDRFGDRSYAIIADKYLNFSSRVGYHYSVIDAYCGDTINKNYITFTFKGGAADSTRRNRRVRAISRILEESGYRVSVKADKVDARLQKYPKLSLEDQLVRLGRLLIFTRQLDMLMTSEESVEWAARSFLSGNYHFGGPAARENAVEKTE